MNLCEYSTTCRRSELSIERQILDRASRSRYELTNTVDGVMVVGGENAIGFGREWKRFGDELERRARIGREADRILGWIGVEEVEHRLPRGFDDFRGGRGRWIVGVRIPEQRIRQVRTVFAYERFGVQGRARIVEVH